MTRLEQSPKSQAFRRILLTEAVYVHLNPHTAGVALPPHLSKKDCVVLAFGYTLPLPTNDVLVDEEGIQATLHFPGNPPVKHPVRIPWHAVFAVVNASGDGVVYDDDVPPHLHTTYFVAKAAPQEVEPTQPPEKQRPALTVLDGGLARKK